jgi:rRNA maturation RNase YbeY
MILNKQKKVRLATRPLREFLRKTQRELNIADSEITIALVTDEEIARWNEAYRNKKGPTDVLSFPATSGAVVQSHEKMNGPSSPARHKIQAKKNGANSAVDNQTEALPSVILRSPLVYPEPRRATRHSFTPASSGPLFLGDIAIAPEAAKKILGDIAIAPETAKRYAKKNGRSLQTEIRVLMLHGLLHLMGYDHESDTGQMNRIEQKLRRRLGIS